MVEETLITFLEELERVALGLQDSLLARDTDAIWGALGRQESSLEKLNQVYEESGDQLVGISGRNETVRRLLNRSKSVLRTNRTLTQTFLSVIDNTLSQLTGGMENAYCGQRAAYQRRAPLLVQQQG